jgi:hypothetical protein
MFGYIVPDKPELKIKEFDNFKGYYCGLCKRLKSDYTFFSRLFLNYDCAFLSLILSAVSDEAPSCKNQACSFSPLKKKKVVYTDASKFAAAINVMLAKNSIKDNIKDEKKFYLLPISWMLIPGYKKAKRDYPKVADIIEKSLVELAILEQAKEKDIDKISDVFATMLGDLIEQGAKTDKRAFKHLGYNLGRWIYLIDAYDDLEDDLKKRCYNPLLLHYEYSGEDMKEFKKKIDEDIRYNLFFSLSEAAKAFDLINIKKHENLLINIIYSGIKKKTESVLLKGELNLDGSIQHSGS